VQRVLAGDREKVGKAAKAATPAPHAAE